MAKILDFPKKPGIKKEEPVEVRLMQATIQSNIIQLADLRHKYALLQKELKRGHLRLIKNEPK